MTTPAQEFIRRIDAHDAGRLKTSPTTDQPTIGVVVMVPQKSLKNLDEIARILGVDRGTVLWDRIGWMFDDPEMGDTREFAKEDAEKRRKKT